MNRRITILISAFFTIAMAALIWFQLYWLKKDFNVREELFREKVDEALNKTAQQFEKINPQTRYIKLTRRTEGLIKPRKTGRSVAENALQLYLNEAFTTDSNGHHLQQTASQELQLDSAETSLPENFVRRLKQNESGLNPHRGELLPVASEQFDYFDRTLTENYYNVKKQKLDTTLIDSLLKNEFNSRNIKGRYVYYLTSLYPGSPHHSDLSMAENMSDSMGVEYYKVRISPANKFVKPEYLIVCFPSQDRLVFMEMWPYLAITTVLLLILLFSFYYITANNFEQKKLSEIKNDFISNMTHEFKTPVAVIKIASGVLLEESNLHKHEKLANYARIIEQQTDHLQMQVERLMTSATRLKTTPRLSFEPVSVNTLIQDSLKQIQPLLEHKKAKVDLLLDESNPQVNADASHLLIAFINLIENSLKYSGDPKIIISSGRTNGHVGVSIKDNGIGIEKKYLKKIFNRFFRIPTGNIHNVKGFGLGLNVVKTILHQHQAKIQVQSVYGIGTEFKLFFPSI